MMQVCDCNRASLFR